MPKTGRRATYYAKLPDEMQTKNLDKVKLDVSLNITVPDELQKKGTKFVEKLHDRLKKALKDWAEDLED